MLADDVRDNYNDLKSALANLEPIIESLPDELITTGEDPYDAGWEQGSIDNSTGEETSSNYRIRTKTLPVGTSIVGEMSSSSGTVYWTRVYSDSAFLGSASFDENGDAQSDANACGNPCKIDTILSVYPAATKVRLVCKWADSGDVISPSQSGMTFTTTHKEINGTPLNNVYVRQSGGVLDEMDERIDCIDPIIESCPPELITLVESQNTYSVTWEQGAISNTDGTESSNSYRIRTVNIPIGNSILGKVGTSAGTVYWTRVYSDSAFLGNLEFDSNGNAISGGNATNNPCRIDTVLNVFPTATKVRLVGKWENSADAIIPSQNGITFVTEIKTLNGTPFNDVYVRKDEGKDPYSSTDITLQYDIDDTYYTKGKLKLPSNYTITGEPVPMIVFVHGSSDYAGINHEMTSNYMTYYNYLRDCGYAVFDCYPWGNKYTEETAGAANTWGLPINTKCYRAGIKYVLKNYNIDKKNVFVSCKSLGGIQALSMYFDPSLSINAVGMLAPAMNPLDYNIGYAQATKHVYASELNFSEDVNHVLDFSSSDPVPEGFRPYIMQNAEKWIGYNPYLVGLDIPLTDKADYCWNDVTTKDLCRHSLGRPLKIWVAEDDGIIVQCDALVESLLNGGYRAELRTLPANTGAHHATDTGPNALQTTAVTTKLDVYYATIPTAYYELEKFFNDNIIK